jgi:hypothetical protein
MALDENGQVWNIKGNYFSGEWFCWERNSEYDPPVPVNQIKFWTPDRMITTGNVFWTYDTGPGGYREWHNCGPWPGGPVPTSPNTWGDLKGKFDGDR